MSTSRSLEHNTYGCMECRSRSITTFLLIAMSYVASILNANARQTNEPRNTSELRAGLKLLEFSFALFLPYEPICNSPNL